MFVPPVQCFYHTTWLSAQCTSQYSYFFFSLAHSSYWLAMCLQIHHGLSIRQGLLSLVAMGYILSWGVSIQVSHFFDQWRSNFTPSYHLLECNTFDYDDSISHINNTHFIWDSKSQKAHKVIHRVHYFDLLILLSLSADLYCMDAHSIYYVSL